MFTLLSLWVISFAHSVDAVTQFAPSAEERIVLVGDALIEREQRYGYLEAALLSRFPGKRLHFRNLGWNADTLEGLSRAYFDPPERGTQRLFEEIAKQKPTILIVGYGMAESLIDSDGAESFKSRLNAFLDKANVNPTATILFSPIMHEDLGPPFPDPRSHQQSLQAYANALRDVADKRGTGFVDLFTRMVSLRNPSIPWTINGIHPSDLGYWRLATLIEEGLGLPADSMETSISVAGVVDRQTNTNVSRIKANPRQIQFDQLETRLPTVVEEVPHLLLRETAHSSVVLRVTGLAEGNYTLLIDDEAVHRATAAEWGIGQTIVGTPQHQQAEKLRQEVIRENRLFFERYRPQNITYLLGFRSHEQGQNAKEIEALDALVAAAEKKIFKLGKPKTHHFVLTRD